MEHKHEEKKEEVKHEIEKVEISAEKKQQQKTVFILISALVLFLLAILIFKFPPKNEKYLTADEAKTKTETFINENLMMPGTKANVTEVIEEYGLYKLTVDVGMGEVIESYIDKKGELFFPQSFEIDTYVNPYLDMDFNMDDVNFEDMDFEDMDFEDMDFEDMDFEIIE